MEIIIIIIIILLCILATPIGVVLLWRVFIETIMLIACSKAKQIKSEEKKDG